MSRASEILALLEQEYPNAHCELNYNSDFQLLVAVILSAQCTDKRVNSVTDKLFRLASTPRQFAVMSVDELEKLIFSCGFYRNKARNIIAAANAIVNDYGERVPQEFDELIKLPGVGRKTANVVSSVCFGGDGIAVDTHVFRTSHRLGLSKGKTPRDVERDLELAINQGDRLKAHHLLIFHGRYRCSSRSPRCGGCALRPYCNYNEENKI